MISYKQLMDHAKKWRDLFLDTLFPIECFGCNEEGSYLCPQCSKKIFMKKIHTCPKCKNPTHFGEICSNCKKTKYISGVMIVTDYKNSLMETLIKKYKYGFVADLAVPLGEILTDFFQKEAIVNNKVFSRFKVENILIIPVPLHKKRSNWRGFNQSEELAKNFSRNLNLKIEKDLLIKTTHTKPQAKLNINERKNNLKNCFRWKGGKINNKCVILIDDITTSGATLNECAKTLKEAGAKNVWGLVLANG